MIVRIATITSPRRPSQALAFPGASLSRLGIPSSPRVPPLTFHLLTGEVRAAVVVFSDSFQEVGIESHLTEKGSRQPLFSRLPLAHFRKEYSAGRSSSTPGAGREKVRTAQRW